MAFVLILLVATSSLVRVNLAGSANEQLGLKARLQADLSARVALGELQRLTGPDTRATAPAELISDADSSNRAWVGVLNAGEDAPPVMDRWGNAKQTGELIEWLISGETEPDATQPHVVDGNFETDDSSRVVMLGETTVTDPGESVTAGRVSMDNGDSYAWWVSDESLKASLLPSPGPALLDDRDSKISLSQSPIQVGHRFISGFETAADVSVRPSSHRDMALALGLADQAPIRERFHDVTAGAWGLFTNPREGGLQYDMTWASEADEAVFGTAIRARPELYNLLATDWEPFQNPPGGLDVIGLPSLDIVRDYHQLKNWSDGSVSLQSNRRIELERPPEIGQVYLDGTPPYHTADAPGTWFHQGGRWFSNYYPKANPLFPVMSRFIFRFGLEYDFGGFSDPPPAENVAPNGYRVTTVRFHYQPIFVLYNPHNVALELGTSDLRTVLGGNMPRALVRVTITPANGDPNRTVAFRLAEIFPSDNGNEIYTNFRLDSGDNVVIEPGEALSFGFQNNSSEVTIDNLAWMPLSSDWNPATRLVHNVRVQPGGPNREVVRASEPGPTASHRDGGANWDSAMNVTNHLAGGRVTGTTDAENRMAKFGLTVDENDDLKAGHPQDFVSVEVIFDEETFGSQAATFSNLQRRSGRQYNFQMLDGIMNPGMGPIRVLDERFAGDFSGSLDYGFNLELAHKEEIAAEPVFDSVSGWFEDAFPVVPFRPLIDGNVRAMAYGEESSGLVAGQVDRGQSTVAPFRLKAGSQSTAAQVLQVNLDPSEPTDRGSTYALTGASSGSGNIPLFEVPREPLRSIAQLQHAALSHLPHHPSYAVANSYAPMRVPRDAAWTRDGSGDPYPFVDLSYGLNRSLYDRFFFSAASRDLSETEWEEMLGGERLPAHPRLHAYDLSGASDELEVYQSNDDASSFFENAARFLARGAFNVNSLSVEAWKAVLSTGYDLEMPRLNPEQPTQPSALWRPGNGVDDEVYFSRFTRPHGDEPLEGVRVISEAEIQDLAEAVVEEVRERGPFLSVADFVNRSLENNENGLRGALQEALDEVVNNDGFISAGTTPGASPFSHWETGQMVGEQSTGYPGWVLQGDVLQRLDAALRTRGDTFVIRAYGEAVAAAGGRRAEAWCELMVQRVPEPVGYATMDPDIRAEELRRPSSPFGRQLKVMDFRWLDKEEL